VTPPSTARSDRLIVALITLAAAWLRLQNLGQPSLWWDEFITVGASLGPLSQMLPVLKYIGPSDIGVELFPPLAHVITHWLTLISHNDALMRLPGALAGVASVPALYLLCRRPLGRMTALSAALLMALSVYHMHYSREVRPYSLFMLENLLALHLLHEGLDQGRKRLLWGFGAVACAMLYTSYMAATLIAAQVLFAGALLARRFMSGQRAQALAPALHLGSALAVAALLYLPWAAGQVNVFALLHDPGFKANFSLDFITTCLKEFAAFAYRGEFPVGWTLAAMAVAGCVAAAVRGQRTFIALMVLWAFMPVAGIFLAKARMELTSRYVFPVFVFLLVFAAHFLSGLVSRIADALFGKKDPIFFARMTVAAALCLLVSGPNLDSVSEYYSRETSHYKELVDALAQTKDDREAILYFNPRNHKLIFDWYGRGMLASAKHLFPDGYHQALLLATQSMRASDKFPQAAALGRFDDVDILGLGLARTPLTPMVPGPDGRYVYRDDFSSFKMLEDAYAASNLVPNLLNKTLTRHDAGQAAWAVYRFQALPGTSLAHAKLTMEFSLRLPAGIPTDDRTVLTVIPEGKAPVEIASVGMESFKDKSGALSPPNHEGKRSATIEVDLGPLVAGSRSFDLRLDCPAFARSGPIEAENFRLEATLDSPAALAAPAEALPEALLAQLPITPWTPGTDMVLSRALYAFSLDGKVSRPDVGSPAGLEAYLREHPGSKPVRVFPYPDGTPAVALFDPALAQAGTRMNPGQVRRLEAFPAGPRQVRSLRLAGALDSPVLTLGAMRLPIEVVSPAPSSLTVNPGGQAELVLSPLFTQDGQALAATSAFDNIRRNDGEDCLSCREDRPCSATFSVDSLPVTQLRIAAFPRVNSAPSGRNYVSTQVSLDGEPWREVNRYEGSGSDRWEGWKIPQYSLLQLDRPARGVRVRFVLSGVKAQLWSAPDARMRLEMRLDAASVPVPALSIWPAQLALSHSSPLDVTLLENPQPFPDRLRRTR
jgi:4-amino-4-deoxy-L-arabinose transferase-like glycosyltransferase